VCALTGADAANDVHCAVRVCAALTHLAKDRGIALDLVKLGVAVTGTGGAEATAPETVEVEPEAIEEDVDVLLEEVPAAEAPSPAGGRTLARTPSVATVLQGMSLAAPAVVLSSGVSLPSPTRAAAQPGALLSAGVRAGDPPKPRHREAYTLWHEGELPLAHVYARMRTPPTLPFISRCKVHNLTRILRLRDQGAGRIDGKDEG
jgi:hypothetical protein